MRATPNPQKVDAIKTAAKAKGCTRIEFVDDAVKGRDTRIIGLFVQWQGKPYELTVDVTKAADQAIVDRHLDLILAAVNRLGQGRP